MANYLKSFVIGSSFPVLALFFYNVSRLPDQLRNYDYTTYTFVAPLYLGLVNMLSVYVRGKFNLSLEETYLIIGPLSGILVAIAATLLQTYNYSKLEWFQYYLRIIITHFLVFNVIIYYLESWIN